MRFVSIGSASFLGVFLCSVTARAVTPELGPIVKQGPLSVTDPKVPTNIRAQSDVACSDTECLAVWCNAAFTPMLPVVTALGPTLAPIDKHPVVLTDIPQGTCGFRLARGATSYLLTWIEGGATSGPVGAMYLGLDGSPLGAPFHPGITSNFHGLKVQFDGKRFLLGTLPSGKVRVDVYKEGETTPAGTLEQPATTSRFGLTSNGTMGLVAFKDGALRFDPDTAKPIGGVFAYRQIAPIATTPDIVTASVGDLAAVAWTQPNDTRVVRVRLSDGVLLDPDDTLAQKAGGYALGSAEELEARARGPYVLLGRSHPTASGYEQVVTTMDPGTGVVNGSWLMAGASSDSSVMRWTDVVQQPDVLAAKRGTALSPYDFSGTPPMSPKASSSVPYAFGVVDADRVRVAFAGDTALTTWLESSGNLYARRATKGGVFLDTDPIQLNVGGSKEAYLYSIDSIGSTFVIGWKNYASSQTVNRITLLDAATANAKTIEISGKPVLLVNDGVELLAINGTVGYRFSKDGVVNPGSVVFSSQSVSVMSAASINRGTPDRQILGTWVSGGACVGNRLALGAGTALDPVKPLSLVSVVGQSLARCAVASDGIDYLAVGVTTTGNAFAVGIDGKTGAQKAAPSPIGKLGATGLLSVVWDGTAFVVTSSIYIDASKHSLGAVRVDREGKAGEPVFVLDTTNAGTLDDYGVASDGEKLVQFAYRHMFLEGAGPGLYPVTRSFIEDWDGTTFPIPGSGGAGGAGGTAGAGGGGGTAGSAGAGAGGKAGGSGAGGAGGKGGAGPTGGNGGGGTAGMSGMGGAAAASGGAGASAGGSAGTGAGGLASGGSAAGGAGNGGAGAGGAATSEPPPGLEDPVEDEPSDGGGCGCETPRTRGMSWVAVGMVAAALIGKRRRAAGKRNVG